MLDATRKLDISRIIKYAPTDLIGRETETKLLSDAWAKVQAGESRRPHILTFVAFGGEGKTSLVAKWAADLAHDNWPGCKAAFAWSFHSQGTGEQMAASSDLFLKEALTFFGDDADKAFACSPAGAFEKGQRLARIVGQRRSLLVLDGLEPLQYAPSSKAFKPGELKDTGIAKLLKDLASVSQGLCVVTTRIELPDLRAFKGDAVLETHLKGLSREAGVHLLKTLGVTGTAQEFETLVEDVKGHALTLTLLGGFLKRAFHGDIRQRDRVKFEKADEKMDGGHAFRTMSAYEQWLLRDGGDEGRREVAVLRLMGLFDRPADAGCLAALRREPIPGLTELLAGLADDDWEYCLSGLEDAKLLTVNRDAAGALVSLDAHPLLREYFAKQLKWGSAGVPPAAVGVAPTASKPQSSDSKESQLDEADRRDAGLSTRDACAPQISDAWRAAHRRLYEHLCATTPDKPQPTLEDLQPLYQAVAHGCHAGLQQDACDKVYHDRIVRAREFYSTRKVGAFGPDLGALANFFDFPWTQISTAIAEADRAWLLTVVAFNLRASGRLKDAQEPMRAGLTMEIAAMTPDWAECARRANNISELQLTLGDVPSAVKSAEQAVSFADRSGDPFERMSVRAAFADALHVAGQRKAARDRFLEANGMQVERKPDYPLLYWPNGFLHCDLLLSDVEFAAWFIYCECGIRVLSNLHSLKVTLQHVEKQAERTAKWAEGNGAASLDVGLDHLTLGRVALYKAILEGRASCPKHAADNPTRPNASRRSKDIAPHFTDARRELDASVDGLRRAGTTHHIPRALLTRAWLRVLDGKRIGPESAQEDLDEAWEIAERGPMKLYMADIHLHRARLFFREKVYPMKWLSPQADLANAKKLINSCGYHRRDEELADAERALAQYFGINTL